MTECLKSARGIVFERRTVVQTNQHPFGSTLEAIVFPVAILLTMWLIHLLGLVLNWELYHYGVLPRTVDGLKGIFFMPWIHSTQDFSHILNNSLPILFLSSTVIFFYRDIALKVLLISWVATGIGVWIIARNHGSYHIGMSGVIYALAAFVFVSGVRRKYLPLQAMALFVAFLYGGMIWGVFPTEERISWEGHLSGLIIGAVLAVLFAKKGPQAPKFQYEIEKEMGIEPPDLEAEYWEKVRKVEAEQQLAELHRQARKEAWLRQQNQAEATEEPKKEKDSNVSHSHSHPVKIIYTYRKPPSEPQNDSDGE